MIQRIELLVHAGAPSRQSDDERYKAQAAAYASFQTSVAIPLRSSAYSGQDIANHVRSQDESDPRTTGRSARAAPVFLEDTQAAYTALDSQLLTSSLRLSSDGHALPDSTPAEQRVDRSSEARLGTKRKRDSQSKDAQQSPASARLGDNLRSAPTHPAPGQESSLQDDGSTTSSYLKSPELRRASKRTKRDVHPTRTASEPNLGDRYREAPGATSEKLPQRVEPDHGTTERSQDPGDGNQSTSELPTSYSLSDITSGTSKARQSTSQRSASDPGPRIGSISHTALRAVPTPRKPAGVQTSESQPCTNVTPEHPPHPATKPAADPITLAEENLAQGSAARPVKAAIHLSIPPRANIPDVKVPSPHPISTSAGDVQPSTESTINLEALKDISTLIRLDALKDVSTSIRPPQPPSTMEQFKTHVTDSLRHLADNIDVIKAYSPVSVSRELRPLERGYWLIRCPEETEDWPLATQIDWWRFLERTIGKGNAGWGVSCIRNDEDEDKANDRRASLGTVKIFCWGEIVRHIYLLMYVGSRSKVKKLGLQWIDAVSIKLEADSPLDDIVAAPLTARNQITRLRTVEASTVTTHHIVAPLLALPAELRNTIYHLVLISSDGDCDGAYVEISHKEVHHRTALPRVYSQIREEASEIFYGTNTFHVTDLFAQQSEMSRFFKNAGPSTAIIPKLTIHVRFPKLVMQLTHLYYRIKRRISNDARVAFAEAFRHLESALELACQSCVDQLVNCGVSMAKLSIRVPRGLWTDPPLTDEMAPNYIGTIIGEWLSDGFEAARNSVATVGADQHLQTEIAEDANEE